MLKPALLYADLLKKLYQENMYDLRNQYYFGWFGTKELELSDNNYDRREFVSVDKDDNIAGFISYNIDYNRRVADNFGIMSFKKTLIFPKDLLQAIDDIFYKYHLDKISWRCYIGNPALRGYRNFIKSHGGRQTGYYIHEALLMDWQFHDGVSFEILERDYIREPKGGEVHIHHSIQHEINEAVIEHLHDMYDLASDAEDKEMCEALKGYMNYMSKGNDAMIAELPEE